MDGPRQAPATMATPPQQKDRPPVMTQLRTKQESIRDIFSPLPITNKTRNATK